MLLALILADLIEESIYQWLTAFTEQLRGANVNAFHYSNFKL